MINFFGVNGRGAHIADVHRVQRDNPRYEKIQITAAVKADNSAQPPAERYQIQNRRRKTIQSRQKTVPASKKNLGIFHGVKTFEFGFMAFQRETNALMFVVVEIGIFIRRLNFFEPRGNFFNFLIQREFIP